MDKLKRLLPTGLKDFVKSSLNIQGHQYSYLLKRARLKQETIELNGAPFTILDGPSFSFLFEEIFIREVYNFKSDIENPCILDLGANIGVSILYFKKIFPKAIITAYEADPHVFKVLSKNLDEQGIHDVKLINKAIWNKKTKLNFTPDGADAGRVTEENSISSFEVETDDIEQVLEEFDKIDLLKIDIEGAEVEVIKRAANQLEKVDRIFVEYHSFGELEGLISILKILNDRHYKIYMDSPGFMNNSPLLEMKPQNGMDFQMNIFAVRT